MTPRLFKVEYKYSACIKIATSDISILCDPWFSDSAYYGTWSRYPDTALTKEFIGDFDAIWLSHIHPDHYCPSTLQKLMDVYGPKTILISDWGTSRNYLQLKLTSDGFGEYVDIVSETKVGETTIRCFPVRTGSSSDIDSALLVADGITKKSVLNFNDCIMNAQIADEINQCLASQELEIGLFCLGYTGAGPYPQTYYSPKTDRDKLIQLADTKKKSFFERYLASIKAIPSKYRLPFAGKYILSGYLSFLNEYRGVADAVEVLDIDSGAVVLDDSGISCFDVIEGQAYGTRSQPYKDFEYNAFDKTINWGNYIGFTPEISLLKRQFWQAARRAHQKSECRKDYTFSFWVLNENIDHVHAAETPEAFSSLVGSCNCNVEKDPFDISRSTIHSDIYIGKKELFGALSGIFHWNNLEVGSAFLVRRKPDIFAREMQQFLNFFCTC